MRYDWLDDSTFLQFRRSPPYHTSRFGEWTVSLGSRRVWFLESLGRKSLSMYVMRFYYSDLTRTDIALRTKERALPFKSWNDYVSHLLTFFR